MNLLGLLIPFLPDPPCEADVFSDPFRSLIFIILSAERCRKSGLDGMGVNRRCLQAAGRAAVVRKGKIGCAVSIR